RGRYCCGERLCFVDFVITISECGGGRGFGGSWRIAEGERGDFFRRDQCDGMDLHATVVEQAATEELRAFEIIVGEFLQQLNCGTRKVIECEMEFECVAADVPQQPRERLLHGVKRMALPGCGSDNLVRRTRITFAQTEGGGLRQHAG